MGQLATDPVWLKLGHYQPASGAASGWRSAVVSAEFFISDRGREDPAAELTATLAAFAEPPSQDADAHPQCRFRARYFWLGQRLSLEQRGIKPVDCPLYRRWTLDGSTESLSLVLATGYLANPASYFGHILLKFNGAGAARYSDLLDVSVNYGAIVPDGANPVAYVLNGTFGGYDGGFSHIQYYVHNHNYSENELRDLWEYRLDLAPDEVALITAHAWELMGKKFTYYFFRQNCAYRMAELIGLVRNESVIPHRPWTIPQSVMQELARAQHRGRTLVSEVRYHPSRQSRFYARFTALDASARRAVARLVSAPEDLDAPDFVAQPAPWRASVIDALLDYYQYSGDLAEAPQGSSAAAYRGALAARFLLPASTIAEPALPPVSPDKGQPSGLVRAGLGYTQTGGMGVVANLRGAYYDALDAGPGQVAHGQLSLAETTLLADDDGLHLLGLDILRVESTQRAVSGLPGDGGSAWRLAVAVQPQNLDCTDCLVARINGGAGYTIDLGRRALGGLLGGGALHSARNDEGVVSGEATAFLHLVEQSRLRGRIEYTYRLPVDGEFSHRQSVSTEIRAQLASHWESRLRYRHHGADEWILSLGRYW